MNIRNDKNGNEFEVIQLVDLIKQKDVKQILNNLR